MILNSFTHLDYKTKFRLPEIVFFCCLKLFIIDLKSNTIIIVTYYTLKQVR